MSSTDLEGQIAIVTGAARNIGAAIASELIRRGATVLIADILESEGTATAEALGSKASFARLDVTDQDSWRRVVDQCTDRHGAPTILVNNAGIVPFARLLDETRDRFLQCMDVNVWGAFLGIQSVAPLMIGAGSGAIVNISSIQGILGLEGLSTYSASKFALRGLTKVAALELGRHGVRVNAVCPGGAINVVKERSGELATRTDTRTNVPIGVPLERAAETSEIATAVAFLVSPDSSYVTGTELVIDGGHSSGFLLAALGSTAEPT